MRKRIAGILSLFLMVLFQGCAGGEEMGQKEILYVGTFSDEGLFVLEFDRVERTFTEIQRITDKSGPNFQFIHPNGQYLYSISSDPATDQDDGNGSVAAYGIDSETGRLTLLNVQSSEGRGPAHVSVDPNGRFAYVSNYGGGSLSVYPIRSDGSLGEAVDVIQHEGSSINERRQ